LKDIKMKVLITGVSGFVGSHLAEYCSTKGAEVHGTVRWLSKEYSNVIKDFVTFHECDITDAFALRDIIQRVMPDYIFHLAAQSYVKASWTEPSQTLNTNIIGELNLLEAIRSIKNYHPRIQIAGSSEEYGHADIIPIKEDAPLKPLSPYGVSKVAQDLLGFQYFKSYGMHIVSSGIAYPIKNILQKLLSMSKIKIEIRKDPNRMRPSDLPVLAGDCSKFLNATGWQPVIKIEQTLEDLLNYWRKK